MIPNKAITKNQFYTILDYQKLFSGGKATICETDTPFSVYKLFSHCSQPIAMPPNKVKKYLDYMMNKLIIVLDLYALLV